MNTLTRLLLLALGAVLATAPVSARPTELKPEFVATLLRAYLEIQTALAADDLSAARLAAESLLASAAKAPELTSLTAPVKNIAHAADLASARKSFLAASHEMIRLVETPGVPGGEKLYLAHCPMAFGGTGGDWLQSDKTVNNPYYGSRMLRCGTVKPVARHSQ
ncbi:DUF3347 domain-containing protein [Horticoccus luteus]|uniref:DUF3347 domain-containing protein n=1 Tax=Horticoccus luteus TaxID=2862869 RepID=A0A8F9TSI2_9BACT|nr:DUF3347 domain-containing protein [Horticoccus luteus]QYM78241.1 DUF3347 domain-containing protein [Horticoccus luteus]